ncbi:homocysteine S-methyltransferase family protein [Pseudooceanicola sp. CBS1P-1]|uniref:Homocysteine S-methyltransferase n=1 Tax=Pseudooceanicola albus TaxID=2692189 RepID=A0A6L7G0D8_9RHOB|nr:MULTISPECIES: homocysteine S-methyltransferase family protein [Pseudooceanicola]MBT9382449.1 homocysteine S-methyltransferase family protein [Pseudooceanicola endophyticus]MXN16990.1 homocysteine S-methyltransferase [Pseudooceanicola albus]
MELLSKDRVWIAWTGLETDLIFNQGVALAHFAAFPLVETEAGRDLLVRSYRELIGIGRDTGAGILLDTPTWMANPDRAAVLGYGPQDLTRITRDAVALAFRVAREHPDVETRVSVQIGPRGDGYQPGIATAEAAAAYHAPQVEAARTAGADLVSAYTLGAAGEAVGLSMAARAAGLPALISFTVETDGRLADGMSLASAVSILAEEAPAAGIMVNCAHPDHIARALDGGSWQAHLCGIVANASRKSHAELDEATELDDGDPEEFGRQLGALYRQMSGLRVLGGCCGTDARHLRATARAARG